MKKYVLVVETYGHPKVLENVFHLLKNNSKVSFLMNKDKHSSYALLFPSSKYAEKVYINKLHSSMIFIPLLFLGRKFDYINISTGPEGSHFSEIINILFFGNNPTSFSDIKLGKSCKYPHCLAASTILHID